MHDVSCWRLKGHIARLVFSLSFHIFTLTYINLGCLFFYALRKRVPGCDHTRKPEQQHHRADNGCGETACFHCWYWRCLLGHPHGLQHLALLEEEEEKGSEQLCRLAAYECSGSLAENYEKFVHLSQLIPFLPSKLECFIIRSLSFNVIHAASDIIKMEALLRLHGETDVSSDHFRGPLFLTNPPTELLAQGDGAKLPEWTRCGSIEPELVQLNTHTLTLTDLWMTPGRYSQASPLALPSAWDFIREV